MKTSFGAFLALKRKEKGLTQKELAEQVFVSESAVSKWEQNRSNPDISVLPLLSELLGVSEHELITASVDTVQRERNVKAKKWSRLSLAWNLFFYISYGITLLTCLIVNLAVDGKLSWFWIVLSSLMLSATFTTLPQFVKTYKLLVLTLTSLATLLLLLAVCCIDTTGDWFWVAAVPVTVGFMLVFLPIYLKAYRFSPFIKRFGELICLLVNSSAVIAMMYVIEHYTETKWVNSVALPLVITSVLIVVLVILAAKYLRINRFFKASVILSVFAAGYPMLLHLTEVVLHQRFGYEMQANYLPNFGNWSDDYIINNNVHALVTATLATLAVVFVLLGVSVYRKGRQKKNNMET